MTKKHKVCAKSLENLKKTTSNFAKNTKEKQSEISRAGGIASGKSKRLKKMINMTFSEVINSCPLLLPEPLLEQLKAQGINIDDLDNRQRWFFLLGYQAASNGSGANEAMRQMTAMLGDDLRMAQIQQINKQVQKMDAEIEMMKNKETQQNDIEDLTPLIDKLSLEPIGNENETENNNEISSPSPEQVDKQEEM